MLFNSYSFIFLFLPLVFLGFFQFARLHRAYTAAWLALGITNICWTWITTPQGI